MRPINFEGANVIYEKPKGMTDEQCMPVSAYQKINENGDVEFVTTVWQPNKEDIEAINAGRPIMLQVFGGLPPVSVFTCDEKGEINE